MTGRPAFALDVRPAISRTHSPERGVRAGGPIDGYVQVSVDLLRPTRAGAPQRVPLMKPQFLTPAEAAALRNVLRDGAAANGGRLAITGNVALPA